MGEGDGSSFFCSLGGAVGLLSPLPPPQATSKLTKDATRHRFKAFFIQSSGYDVFDKFNQKRKFCKFFYFLDFRQMPAHGRR